MSEANKHTYDTRQVSKSADGLPIWQMFLIHTDGTETAVSKRRRWAAQCGQDAIEGRNARMKSNKKLAIAK